MEYPVPTEEEEIGGVKVGWHELNGAMAGKHSFLTLSGHTDPELLAEAAEKGKKDGDCEIYIGLTANQARTLAKSILVRLGIL